MQRTSYIAYSDDGPSDLDIVLPVLRRLAIALAVAVSLCGLWSLIQ